MVTPVVSTAFHASLALAGFLLAPLPRHEQRRAAAAATAAEGEPILKIHSVDHLHSSTWLFVCRRPTPVCRTTTVQQQPGGKHLGHAAMYALLPLPLIKKAVWWLWWWRDALLCRCSKYAVRLLQFAVTTAVKHKLYAVYK